MKLKHNVALRDYSSLHAGGSAQNLIELEAEDSLADVVKTAKTPIWVLGWGANVLISDKGLPGTVIVNRTGKISVSGNKLTAGSGANWDELVQTAIKHKLWGLEFTSGIPGGVGAAVIGNIAAYGHKVADTFQSATMLNAKTDKIETWNNPQFEFGYRSSCLNSDAQQPMIILDATFRLSQQPTNQLEYESALRIGRELDIEADSLDNRRRIIMETRKRAGSLLSNSSNGPWTAGSFFKNPTVRADQAETILEHEESSATRDQLLRQNKIHMGSQGRVSAAHVLLAAGFSRGQKWGQVRLHPDHVLKVENLGDATATEIYDVVQNIIRTVKDKLDIDLEPEVRFLGDF